MDIFAHALWTGAAAIAARRCWNRPVSVRWAVLWGVFPDLAAFAAPAAVRIFWLLTGTTKSLLPQAGGPRLDWVWPLYHGAHSAALFAVAFAGAWLAVRRPPWALLGWAMHIVIDIPTHRGLFATHFLWPLSGVSLDGIPWETGWLLAANYAALALAYALLWSTRRKEAAPARGHTVPPAMERSEAPASRISK